MIDIGIRMAWEMPELVPMRADDLFLSAPASYTYAAMSRLSDAMDGLDRIEDFSAAVYLCSLSKWSVRPKYMRPAADILADRDVPVLRRMLSAAVLSMTQADRSPRGRPEAGAVEELRDLGIAVATLDATVAEVADHLGHHDSRQVSRARSNWLPLLWLT